MKQSIQLSLILSLFILLSSKALMAENDIKFTSGTWKEVLAEAKAANKLVFVDAYTTWCGPCKWMAKNIFTNDTVADFYNSNFINAKFDMEKGEGIDMAKTYGVKAYPTFLYVDGDGNLVHRSVGSAKAPKFIDWGAAAMDPTRAYVSLKNRFDAGDRDKQFVEDYLVATSSAYESTDDIALEYMQNVVDQPYTVEDVVMALTYMKKGDKATMDFMAQLRKDYPGEEFRSKIDSKMQGLYRLSFKKAYKKNEAEDGSKYLIKEDVFKTATDNIRATDLEYKDLLLSEAQIYYNQIMEKWEDYAGAVVSHLNAYPSDNWRTLNSYAWTFYENLEDKAMLQKAAAWAKESVRLEDHYYNNDTYGAILYKLGDFARAEAALVKAIAKAEELKMDHENSDKLLEEIKAASIAK